MQIDQSQYSRIEGGKVEPTLSTLEKIAQVFEVNLADLLKENNNYEENINLPLLEKVKLIDQLEKDEKDCLLKIIDIAINKKMMKDTLSKLVEV